MSDTCDLDVHIFVAGHRGMIGAALMRRLQRAGYRRISTRPARLDYRDQAAVHACLREVRPDVVLVAAARTGGILAAEAYPAEFIRDNLAMELNIIHAAREVGVDRLIFLAANCIYPAAAPQPVREDDLLGGPLRSSAVPHAVAKIAGVTLCEAFNRQYGTRYVSLVPANVYGPGDNDDLHSGQVVPALIRKAHEAKWLGAPEMNVWGTGRARREFLHVDDLADACLFAMAHDLPGPLYNVGSGRDVTIHKLAETIKDVVGYKGGLCFDDTQPDGAARTLLDSGRMNRAGWSARIDLGEGLDDTYRAFSARRAAAAARAGRLERRRPGRAMQGYRWNR